MTALYYCPAELEILKCCPKGENINVVNASCTNQLGFDDFIKRVEPTVISEFRKIRMDDYRLIIFRKSLLLPSKGVFSYYRVDQQCCPGGNCLETPPETRGSRWQIFFFILF